MIEKHIPFTSADRWAQIVRNEVRRRADPDLTSPVSLENIEVLLCEAVRKSRLPVGSPRLLSRFPFFVLKPLWRLIVAVYESLFRNQRALNSLLLQALQESLSVIRTLAVNSAAPPSAAGDDARLPHAV